MPIFISLWNVDIPATVNDCACTLRPWVPIPVKFSPEPMNEVAVTTPVNIPSPLTVKADETVVVPIPKLVLMVP